MDSNGMSGFAHLMVGLVPFVMFGVLLAVANFGFQYKDECSFDTPFNISNFVVGMDSDTMSPFTVNSTCFAFSQTYAEARNKFRNMIRNLEKELQTSDDTLNPRLTLDRIVVVPGSKIDKAADDDEDFTIDIAVLHGKGPGLVVHSSGVHGIEGYTGSAIQIAFLTMLIEHHRKGANNLPTLILIHAINPFGMAHYRRWNENNVDLNRNGLTPNQWGKEYVENHFNSDNYKKFDDTLFNPALAPTWFYSSFEYWFMLLAYGMRFGILTLKGAQVGGQYYNPKGIFYGGNQQVEPSIRLLQDWFDDFFKKYPALNAADIATTWIDVHTGLGELGEDTYFPTRYDAQTIDQLVRWFPVTVTQADNNPDSKLPTETLDRVYRASGLTQKGYEQVQGTVINYFNKLHFSHQKSLLFAEEFGTLPMPLVGHALAIENAAYHYCNGTQEKLEWARKTISPAFYPESKQYRKNVLTNGLRVFQQAIERTVILSSEVSENESDVDVDVGREVDPATQFVSAEHDEL